ncbi:MAG: transglycosylase SLT domain-containing protein [bacterium]|nr:transglycosylase SLT domain-containing protein [bacterium]
MVPTICDAVGAPIPGLSGVRPAPTPVPFAEVLRNLRLRPTTTGVAAPGGVTARTATLPAGFAPRIGRPSAPAPGSSGVGALVPSPFPMLPSPLRTASSDETVAVPAAATDDTAAATPRDAGRRRDTDGLVAEIHRSARSAGVDPALSVAVARAESSLDPTARSADGLSKGTFQVTWYTEAEMKKKIARGTVERPEGSDDVALGVGYLRYLHDLFGREAKLGGGLATTPIVDPSERRLFAVAAYNAGEGRVARAQARAERAGLDPTDFDHVRPFLPRITQGYVTRVTQYTGEERARPTLA